MREITSDELDPSGSDDDHLQGSDKEDSEMSIDDSVTRRTKRLGSGNG